MPPLSQERYRKRKRGLGLVAFCSKKKNHCQSPVIVKRFAICPIEYFTALQIPGVNLSARSTFEGNSALLPSDWGHSGAPRGCKALVSVAPYLRKCGNLSIRHVTVRPSAPQAYQCKITQSTGMATQMQLEVILAEIA